MMGHIWEACKLWYLHCFVCLWLTRWLIYSDLNARDAMRRIDIDLPEYVRSKRLGLEGEFRDGCDETAVVTELPALGISSINLYSPSGWISLAAHASYLGLSHKMWLDGLADSKRFFSRVVAELNKLGCSFSDYGKDVLNLPKSIYGPRQFLATNVGENVLSGFLVPSSLVDVSLDALFATEKIRRE